MNARDDPLGATGLVVDGLAVDYPTAGGAAAPALRSISLTVAPGEALAIVGESGCGKSTFALAVTRLLPDSATTRGSVRLDDDDVLDLAGRSLRRWWTERVAMVFQDPAGALNPTMRVGAQIAEVLSARGSNRAEARQRTADLLAQVSLGPADAIARRFPHELSGGQKQRVVIAMALAVEPRLLVLDEPTTGLDRGVEPGGRLVATVEAEVLGLIADLRRTLDASVVFVTHDLSIVPTVCERVAVLYAGEVVEIGAVSAVLSDPVHPYTRALLASVPSPGRTKRDTATALTAIPGSPPVLGQEPPGCGFAPRCARAETRCSSSRVPLEASADGRSVRCLRAGEVDREVVPTIVALGRHASTPDVDVASARATPLLEVIDVSKSFGPVRALDAVSLSIGEGEIVGLVGESGSGKSTLARVIVGLAAPDRGSVRLRGRPVDPDVRRRRAEDRRSLQIVFQHPEATLNPRHRVRHVLGRALHTLGGTRELSDLARDCQIDPRLLDRRAGTLSGGQQQRVAIARALAGDTELVVCDEPVSALDVSVQAGILELLVDLQRRRQTSCLFISHDLAVVAYLADRVVVMRHGRIVEQGPTAVVLGAPEHPYTRSLLAARSLGTGPTHDDVGARADPTPRERIGELATP